MAKAPRKEEQKISLEERNRAYTKELYEKSEGMTLTGVRLTDPENGEVGLVVTLSLEEAGPVVEAIREVLNDR